MVLAARAASTGADRERDAALARYNDEHSAAVMKRGGAGERTLRRLAVQEAAFARVETVIAAHDAQLGRQRALADRLSFLSPALLTYRAIAGIAGTGEARHHDFLARIHHFHMEWREFFLTRARAGAPLALADYDAMPRFSQPGEALASPFAPLMLGVGAPALILAVLAWRSFRRCKA
jgi:ABC-2 type transport system permease protein